MVHRRRSRSATCISKSETEILPPHGLTRRPVSHLHRPTPSRSKCIAKFYDMRRLRRKLSRTIAQAKRDWAFEFASKIESANMWKLNDWHKGIRRYSIPPFTRRDGSTAISDQDKADTFLDALFPPPAVDTLLFPLDDFNSTDSTTAEGEVPPRLFPVRPFQDVTMREVEENPKSSSQTSASGSSGISFRPLRWAWEASPEIIF